MIYKYTTEEKIAKIDPKDTETKAAEEKKTILTSESYALIEAIYFLANKIKSRGLI